MRLAIAVLAALSATAAAAQTPGDRFGAGERAKAAAAEPAPAVRSLGWAGKRTPEQMNVGGLKAPTRPLPDGLLSRVPAPTMAPAGQVAAAYGVETSSTTRLYSLHRPYGAAPDTAPAAQATWAYRPEASLMEPGELKPKKKPEADEVVLSGWGAADPGPSADGG